MASIVPKVDLLFEFALAMAIAFSKTEEVDRLILLLKNMTDEQLQEQLSFVAQLGQVQSVLRIMGEIDEN